MKQIITVSILIALSASVFARRITWKTTEKPSVSIIAAVEAATKELNGGADIYYCVGASVAKTFSDCDWELRFYSTSGDRRLVSVGSDGKIHVTDTGFEY